MARRKIALNLDPSEARIVVYCNEPSVKIDLGKIVMLAENGLIDCDSSKMNDVIMYVLRVGIEHVMKNQVAPIEGMTIGELLAARAEGATEV